MALRGLSIGSLTLLQSYLLAIITRKDCSNLFYLYYRSYLSEIALVIHVR